MQHKSPDLLGLLILTSIFKSQSIFYQYSERTRTWHEYVRTHRFLSVAQGKLSSHFFMLLPPLYVPASWLLWSSLLDYI